MKIKGLVKNHKIVFVTIALAGVYATGVSAYYNSSMSEEIETVKSTPKVTESKVVPVEETKEPEVVVESEPVAQTQVVPVQAQPAPVEAPKVLSTQEYGEMYLDLTSSPLLQECFDIIVNRWQHRFTEDVREDNVKALRAFASTCSTGVLGVGTDIIASFGKNGEFFDSELANQFKN